MLPFAFDVGGLGLEFCVFVVGWRHALRGSGLLVILGNEDNLQVIKGSR